VGVVVGVAAILAAAFFVWRRKNQQKRNAVAGTGYSQAMNGTEAKLHEEKEMRAIENGGTTSYTPVEHHAGFEDVSPVAPSSRDSNHSWTHAGEAGDGINVLEEPYQDDAPETATRTQAQQAVPAHEAARHASMSSEEQARWDEEEARIDEAIAAAERNRR